jgi:hypothetical protein
MITFRATLLLGLALTVGGPMLAAPAQGQTLKERLEAVRQEQARRKAQEQPVDARTRILQALLHGKITAEFDKTPAREALEFFRTALDINMIVRYSDDPVGHGIDPVTPITLSAEKLRALDVLELILEQSAVLEPCTWQLRRSFLEVGTRERLSAPAAQEIRTYPVDELLFRPPRFEDAPAVGMLYEDPYWGVYGGYGGGYFVGQPMGGSGGYSGSIQPMTTPSTDTDEKRERARELINLVIETIEPDAWTINGGTWASIHYQEGALIVRAPDYIHRKLGGYPHVPPPRTKPPATPKPAGSAPAQATP